MLPLQRYERFIYYHAWLSTMTLDSLHGPLEMAVDRYLSMIGSDISAVSVPKFAKQPDKPYFARSDIQLAHNGTNIEKIVAIVFLPSNSTGEKIDAESMVVSRGFEFSDYLGPRRKDGVIAEGFLPLFSLVEQQPVMYAASMTELMKSDSNIYPAWSLGQRALAFKYAMDHKINQVPEIHLTTGYDRKGMRFGDPHCFVNDSLYTQCVGYLTITEKRSPLLEKSRDWTLPSVIS
jgi:hypothetical protein